MKDKIVNWFVTNRLPIWYTVGSINVLSGIADMASGNIVYGVFWIVLGSVILYDTYVSKDI